MKVDLATLISIITVTVAVCTLFLNNKRARSNDDRQDASEMTTVIVKLENIGDGIKELKSEMQSMKDEIRLDHDMLIEVKESVKQAHRQINELKAKYEALDEQMHKGHLPME